MRPWSCGERFGHSTTYSYDSNGLYLTESVVTATPSPNLTTNFTYNSIGQLILSTKVNGSQSIAEQIWLDSWGRTVGTVENCVTAVAPPSLCNATPGPATNVMTRFAYDLNGNLVDRYDQGQTSGSWVDTHYAYDADNNQVATVQNCVSSVNPCDGTSNASQNVVITQGYDVLNNLTDSYAPLPSCASSCVPLPGCSTGGVCGTVPAPCAT